MQYFDPNGGAVTLNLQKPLAGGPPTIGIATMQATRDPLATDDVNANFRAGAVWFNAAPGQLRMWLCRDATAGAAKWIFDGADYANGGTNPPIEITQFGGAATAQMAEEGNINRVVTPAGVQPASLNADVVLAVYQLPAGAFDQAGRGLNVMACGSTASNTNSKRVKIVFGPTSAVVGSAIVGGTVIADSGVINTVVAAGGWSLTANVFKSGSAGSNTQLAIHEAAQAGNTVGALLAPAPLTVAESGPILVAVTGNAATVVTDITFNFLDVNAMN